jgi:hypothetical protein
VAIGLTLRLLPACARARYWENDNISKEMSMFITPFMAAVLLGTFWTGVATTAVVSHNGGWDGLGPRSDVNITATTTDHQAACGARYHSYNSDPNYPDQWLGRDGQWHVCTL